MIALSPILNIIDWYQSDQKLVFVPIGIDSLTITIWQYLLLWSMFGVPSIIFTSVCLAGYPGRKSLFGFNKDRPVWSTVWSILSIGTIAYATFMYVEPNSRIMVLERLYTVLLVVLVLHLRTAVIYSNLFERAHSIKA
ncbi:MAG TPA: hypothetical protein VLX91_15530 [Candidatus Acidoferrales bacterium]|nr:hypothetical protein [Candidatus Acidoferrales bacterium]